MLIPWLLLAFSLALLGYATRLSLVVLSFSLVWLSYLGVLDSLGLGFIAIGAILAYLQIKYRNIFLEVLIVCFVIALLLHFIPGFHNPKILDKVLVSENSAPYSMYFNLDKALIPFFLLAALPTLFVNKSIRFNKNIFIWFSIILLPILLLLFATSLGLLQLEYHVPEWFFSFVLANIFFVSLAEEALFRGYLQQRLANKIGQISSLLIVSLIFGSLHYQGGLNLILFATLAGIIYGLAWMLSGKLWISVFIHFMTNCLHLIFFTYPLYVAR